MSIYQACYQSRNRKRTFQNKTLHGRSELAFGSLLKCRTPIPTGNGGAESALARRDLPGQLGRCHFPPECSRWSKEEIRSGPRFGGCQLWGASLTGERPLSGGRPAILRAALRTDAQGIADRYTWHAAWPRAAVFAACRPAPVVAQDALPVFDCAAAGLICRSSLNATSVPKSTI